MTLNIILFTIFIVGVSFVLVKRKGWKTALIMMGILFGTLVIVSGAIGFLF
jgi:hypothetical protein